MWKRSRFWNVFREGWIILAIVAGLWLQGASLGLSDDEAYYWVLAQKPALGYAYHPPMVAWLIATAQWALGSVSSAMVRLPAAICAGGMLIFVLFWLRSIGADRNLKRSLGVLISFAGFFSLSWMMVPDLPMFLGWTVTFFACWRICFQPKEGVSWAHGLLAIGITFLILSKYTGVFGAISAFIAILLWGKGRNRNWAIAALVVGGVAALTPILIWNAGHQWSSLLWQVKGRHEGADLSWIRFFRFWAVEALLAGPPLLSFAFLILKKSLDRSLSSRKIYQYFALWILPAALVFCIQPLFSDFKPHWAFIVWWPAAIAMAWEASRLKTWKLARAQMVYGWTLGILVILSCHIPVGTWIAQNFKGEGKFDPRLDVTNDLYGWQGLDPFINQEIPISQGIPVIGSRYQTASQAMFSLYGQREATLIPVDVKSADEWPDLGISEDRGPAWPKLTKTIFFVTDNRYDAPPEFSGARCERQVRKGAYRAKTLIKWIDVWRCVPEKARF